MSKSKESSQEIGVYLHGLRKERKLTLKEVSEYLGIDVSTLSKIENGERQLQSHMIAPIADVFEIDFKSIQVLYINQKITREFGHEPYFNEAIKSFNK